MQHRIAQFLAFFMVFYAPIAAGEKADENPWQMWQTPGVHAIMRHATAPGVGDPPGFQLEDCRTQRNLSAAGQEEARKLGEAIRTNRIELTAVYSSQWCRCMDTASKLKLGKVIELPALNSFFENREEEHQHTQALKKHIAQLHAGDKVLYVTHQVNITALTGVFPQSGEVVLFTMSANGQVNVIGRLTKLNLPPVN